MLRKAGLYVSLAACLTLSAISQGGEEWSIDTNNEWREAKEESEGLSLDKGLAAPTDLTPYLGQRFTRSERAGLGTRRVLSRVGPSPARRRS